MADGVLQEESCIGCPPTGFAGRLTMVKVAGERAVQLVKPDGGASEWLRVAKARNEEFGTECSKPAATVKLRQ